MIGHVLASSGGSSDWITKSLTGIAAVVGSFTAYRAARRDSNANDLKDALANLRKASARLDDVEADLIDMRSWQLAAQLAAAAGGVDLPKPPVLRSEHTS